MAESTTRLPIGLITPAVSLILTGLLLPASAQETEEQTGQAVYSDAGADICLQCHDEDSEFPVFAIFKTPHAIKADKRTPFAQAQCESCHGPGGVHTGVVDDGPDIIKFGQDSDTPIEEQNAICAECHSRALGPNWHGSAHEAEEVTCTGCHKIHAARDPVFSIEQQPDVCFTCHKDKKADVWRPSVHPIRYGKMACTACHTPHGSVADAQLVRNDLNENCYSCHQEKRGPFLWEHAPVPEDCSLCHRPHGSNHPALLTLRPPTLCQQCHSQAGHPSIAFDTSGLPSQGGASPFLLAGSCLNCHSQIHGSNHPSGAQLTR